MIHSLHNYYKTSNLDKKSMLRQELKDDDRGKWVAK
jgi:hypothetical protein